MREVTIVNDLGLHARPAAHIARIAQAARGPVWLMFGGERADASSILDLLALGSSRGTRVTIGVEDPADRPVLEALVRLFESGFEE
jgi:phosphocarrier protein